MKIWEAIIYGIFGGITELLPISFTGHAALLRNAFHMSSLSDGGGYFVRAAICIGVSIAIYLAFPLETGRYSREISAMIRPKKLRRGQKSNRLNHRSVVLCLFAFVFMLFSLFFLASAERIERLLYVIVFFLLNAGLLYLCCRGQVGKKNERTVTLLDMFLIGVGRMLSVFPGLSSLGSSIGIGRARGVCLQYNIRIAYMLTLAFQIVSFFFYLIRGFAYGAFSTGILLPCLFAMLFSAVFGYLAIQYFRYLLQRMKLYVFVYYSLEVAAVAAILALINS